MNERSDRDAAERDGERRQSSAHPLPARRRRRRSASGLPATRFGVWMGTVSARPRRRSALFSPLFDEFAGDVSVLRRPSRVRPPPRRKSATKVLIEEARSTALEIAGAADAAGSASQQGRDAGSCRCGRLRRSCCRKISGSRSRCRSPKKADDLKAISGIGPKLEKVLNGLGIWTYRADRGVDTGRDRLGRRLPLASRAGSAVTTGSGRRRALIAGRQGQEIGERRWRSTTASDVLDVHSAIVSNVESCRTLRTRGHNVNLSEASRSCRVHRDLPTCVTSPTLNSSNVTD